MEIIHFDDVAAIDLIGNNFIDDYQIMFDNHPLKVILMRQPNFFTP